jgi:hypothetical protein
MSPDAFLVAEPVGRDEVGETHAAHLVPVLVVLHRITDLAGPEYALRVLVSAVQPRIDGHLADLVTRADAETRLVGLDRLDEYLGDRQAFVGQVVIGERVRLVAVVEEDHPPRARRWCMLLLGIEGERSGSHAPHGIQILVPLCVEGRDHALYVGIGDGSRLVDYGDLQHGALLALWQSFARHRWRFSPPQRNTGPVAAPGAGGRTAARSILAVRACASLYTTWETEG